MGSDISPGPSELHANGDVTPNLSQIDNSYSNTGPRSLNNTLETLNLDEEGNTQLVKSEKQANGDVFLGRKHDPFGLEPDKEASPGSSRDLR